MRCIGTLEFVSDFHNKCHQTQRQLLLERERLQKIAKDEIDADFESDKENASPPHSNTEVAENVSRMSVPFKRKSSRVENKMVKLQKVEYTNGILHENTKPGSNSLGNSELGRNPLTTDIHDECGNRNGLKKVPNTRLGRKTRERKGSGATIGGGKVKKTEKKVSRSSSERNAPIRSKAANPTVALGKKENFTESSSEDGYTCQNLERKFVDVAKEEVNRAKRVPTKMVKMENFDSDTVLVGTAPLVKSDQLARVPSRVLILTTDRSPRVASTETTATSPRPGDEAGETRQRGCDAVEGRAADDTSEIVSIEDDRMGTKGLPRALMTRKSVIESVRNGKTMSAESKFLPANADEDSARKQLSKVAGQENEMELVVVPNNLSRSTTPLRESSCIVSKGFDETGRAGSFRERRNKSEGQFGKLSELITDEQKEIIETLYTVNMGVVDDEEVYKNIKILDKVKFKCEICGKTYPRMDKCQVHVWGHLNMRPYCCKSCDFVTLTVSNIRCHIRKRHLKIKPFQCNLCEKTYGTAVLLEEHINSHTGAKPYKCKLCDFATSNRQVLSYHKTTHKPVKDVSCEVCGKKFFSNCRMRAHMIVHNKDKSLMCKFCSTYLCNAEALEKHYQKVHSRDYVCDICGVRTRSKKALTNHENVHSEAKYRCSLCSNAYKSKHMLKEHILKHQGIRKYKCELCQKSFAQQSHIAAHMSVHMGKRYPCPGCNKLFNRRDNMRIHTRRCKIFKSNPDARSLRTRSLEPTTPRIETDYRSIAASAEPGPVTESTERSKTDTEIPETDLGLIRINLLSEKTDYSNSHDLGAALRDEQDHPGDPGFDQFQSNDGEVLRIGEVDIFPLADDSNVVGARSEGNAVVTENVLRPECF